MATNNSRSMSAEMAQGTIDSTYMALTPNRGGVVEHPPVERMSWPTYQHVEMYKVSPFVEAHISRAGLPVEFKGGAR